MMGGAQEMCSQVDLTLLSSKRPELQSTEAPESPLCLVKGLVARDHHPNPSYLTGFSESLSLGSPAFNKWPLQSLGQENKAIEG